MTKMVFTRACLSCLSTTILKRMKNESSKMTVKRQDVDILKRVFTRVCFSCLSMRFVTNKLELFWVNVNVNQEIRATLRLNNFVSMTLVSHSDISISQSTLTSSRQNSGSRDMCGTYIHTQSVSMLLPKHHPSCLHYLHLYIPPILRK
ncbi:hypothetical protein K469DRAFT_21551 [Zopfia rhizophila CBS 207.26]|uniref:Uncharacterized protein n=1 Tax=Zopfia rhizophila CBS 207.26 TaxID=1314779 RepID=A0A6A6EGG7_9PEZI|nr:hypothetical protein K469DRAFT_50340 [Zopfia rhizophila CBS 207.26]KAF2189984.1 hypothetical protein K469DRAFT_21551 [Zopfia rhizophila CBS 207.26]